MSNLKNKIEKDVLASCLLKIEQKLNWGSSDHWNTQDFEALSERLLEETQVLLSSTTLKRLWGKVQYHSSPNTKTLDALAQFIGEKNWRTYKQKEDSKAAVESVEFVAEETKSQRLSSDWQWFLVAGIALVAIIWYAFNQSATPTETLTLDTPEFSFKSRPVAEGLPNSVIFEYDASAAPANAVVEIQQSWDASKRNVVSAEEQLATSIYYTPGYFNAKLVVNDQIVAQHDVFIPTNGWLGLAEQQPVPIYFERDQIKQTDQISIAVELLEANAINPRLNDTYVSIYRVEDFGVEVGDFAMETTFKNTFGGGASACQKVEIILFCSGQAIIIPFSIPGCIAQNRLWVLDTLIDGKTHDLSAFGTDFSDWVKVKCVSKDGQISFWVNDTLAYELPLATEADRKIVGIRYLFQGTGAVKSLSF
ncbi:MAG: hypothetical protein AAF806_07760 [Bacteroidota bacterium]